MKQRIKNHLPLEIYRKRILAHYKYDIKKWKDKLKGGMADKSIITEFDIDRGSYIRCNYLEAIQTIANKIIKNHGEQCDTYKTAVEYRTSVITESEFKLAIRDCYLEMLKHEYKYRMSREAIEETIEANEYEFTDNGKIY